MKPTEGSRQRTDSADADADADSNRWPRPLYNHTDEPHFVFILTLPYAGSTSVAKYLATSPNIGLLRANGEGQRLVPGIDRNWFANTRFDGESVRSTWLNRYQEKNHDGSFKIIVEKSPPNMVRIDALRSLFRKTTCLVNNRDPVAFCSSTFFRNTPKVEQLGEAGRLLKLKKCAVNWVKKSYVIREYTTAQSLMTFSYEQFCDSPQSLKTLFEEATGEKINPEKDPLLKIKDYPRARIENKNKQQVSRLSQTEIEVIVEILRRHSALTSFFGYTPESWLLGAG